MSSQRSPSQHGSQDSQDQKQNVSSSSSSGNSTSHSSHSDSTSHSVSSGTSLSYSSGMDTVPITQEMPDTQSVISDDELETVAWGRLIPERSPPFSKLYMVKDMYSFGRGTEECDVVFTLLQHGKSRFFASYSKLHFTIERKNMSSGVFVFLNDHSSNGTFINGKILGKGQSQALLQFDEIALSHKRNKAFVYHNLLEMEESNLPKELTDRYLLTKVLGEGAYGHVRLAFERCKGDVCKIAVKIISNKKLTAHGTHQLDTRSEVMKEVEIMKNLQHPCIVKVMEVIESEDKTYILMELIEGGELFDRVVRLGKFTEPISKLLFYQMLLAVEYLHSKGVTHRDLKPENILLCSPDSEETLIKVADFGVSKLIDAKTMLKTLCGTPNYLAPEVLASNNIRCYDSKVDCWSLGVILFICLSGTPPFSADRKDMSLEAQIMSGSLLFVNELWFDVSKEAVDLVKQLLTVDPKKRPTITEALAHPWLQDQATKDKAKLLMYPGAEFAAPTDAAPQAIKKRPREGMESCTEASAAKSAHLMPKKNSPEKQCDKPKLGSPTKRK